MLSRLIAPFLKLILEKFIVLGQQVDLEVSLWNGKVTLHNAPLKLPFGSGKIRSIQVNIPWTSIWKEPIQIKVEGIEINACETNSSRAHTPNINQQQISASTCDPNEKSYASKVLTFFLSNVWIIVDEITIAHDICIHQKSRRVKLCVNKMELKNTTADWQDSFLTFNSIPNNLYKIISIDGIYLSIGLLGGDLVIDQPVVRGLDAKLRVSLTYASNSSPAPDVTILCNIESNDSSSLALAVNEDCAATFLGFFEETRSVYYAPEGKQSTQTRGYAMILKYAKDWILSDCLEIASDVTIDEEDEFEDAISPPSLSVSIDLERGFGIEFQSSMDDKSMLELKVGCLSWRWRQSCVDNEIHVMVSSIGLYHRVMSNETFTIIRHESKTFEPVMKLNLVLPSYDSKMVGSVTTIDLHILPIHFSIDRHSVSIIHQLVSPYTLRNRNKDPHTKSSHQHRALSYYALDFTIKLEYVTCILFVSRENLESAINFGLRNLTTETIQSQDKRVTSCAIEEVYVKSNRRTIPMFRVCDLVWFVRHPNGPLTELISSECRHAYSPIQIEESITRKNYFEKEVETKDQFPTELTLTLPPLLFSFLEEEIIDIAWIYGTYMSADLEIHEDIAPTPQIWDHSNCILLSVFKCSQITFQVTQKSITICSVCLSGIDSTISWCSQVTKGSVNLTEVIGVDHENARWLHFQPAPSLGYLGINFVRCPQSLFTNTLGKGITLGILEKIAYHCGHIELVLVPRLLNYFVSTASLVVNAVDLKKRLRRQPQSLEEFPKKKVNAQNDVPRDKLKRLCREVHVSIESLSIHLRYGIEVIAVLDTNSFQLNIDEFCVSLNGSMFLEYTISGKILGISFLDKTAPSYPPAHQQVVGSTQSNIQNIVDIEIQLSKKQTPNAGMKAQIRLTDVAVIFLNRFYEELYSYTMQVFAPLRDIWFRDFREIYADREKEREYWPSDDIEEHSVRLNGTDTGSPEIELFTNNLRFSFPRSSAHKECLIVEALTGRLCTTNQSQSSSDFLRTGCFQHEERIKTDSMVASDLTRSINRERFFLWKECNNIVNQGLQSHNEETLEDVESRLKKLDLCAKSIEDIDYMKMDDMNTWQEEVRRILQSAGLDNVTFEEDKNRKFEDCFLDVNDTEFRDVKQSVIDKRIEANWFAFELNDLSIRSSETNPYVVEHAALSGIYQILTSSPLREMTVHEEEANPSMRLFDYDFHVLTLSTHDLHIDLASNQYEILAGVILENFGETSVVVPEFTLSECVTCGGHHDASSRCRSVWFSLPIVARFASLRLLATTDTENPTATEFNHAIFQRTPETRLPGLSSLKTLSSADESFHEHYLCSVFFEMLRVGFVLKTCDSLQLIIDSQTARMLASHPNSDVLNELISPLYEKRPDRGHLQVQYFQELSWAKNRYHIHLNRLLSKLDMNIIFAVEAFFVNPMANFSAYTEDEVSNAIEGTNFRLDIDDCLICLVENEWKTATRALAILAKITYEHMYNMNVLHGKVTKDTEIHASFEQRGIYLTSMPAIEVDTSVHLFNHFKLAFDYFYQVVSPSEEYDDTREQIQRRTSVALHPVEAYLAVEECLWLLKIASNFISLLQQRQEQSTRDIEDNPSPSLSKKASIGSIALLSDSALGQIGDVRLVLVNYGLGIPIIDFKMEEIFTSYTSQNEDVCFIWSCFISLNYFNNSIYRWEPFIETFQVQCKLTFSEMSDDSLCVEVQLPDPMNWNITHAMEMRHLFDLLLNNSSSTTIEKPSMVAPFWLENNTGADVTFVFQRGSSSQTAKQKVRDRLPVNERIALDCRELNEFQNFDALSADVFYEDTKALSMTFHTLSIWMDSLHWTSEHQVIVDVVGNHVMPMRWTLASKEVDDVPIPSLVAEVSIQEDGSKFINLHSQVVIENDCSVPLMMRMYSPFQGGQYCEWMCPRNGMAYAPLALVHPRSQLSLRPSPQVEWAPLFYSLGLLNDEWKTTALDEKSANKEVRSDCALEGVCVCNSILTGDADASRDDGKEREAVRTELRNVLPDFPSWRCIYKSKWEKLSHASFQALVDKPFPTHELTNQEQQLRRKSTSQHINEGNESKESFSPLQSCAYYTRRMVLLPFLTLQNAVGCPLAYRLLSSPIQLIAEGILPIGYTLPLVQIDGEEKIFISLRLENYFWSQPYCISDPTMGRPGVPPFKERTLRLKLPGRDADPMDDGNSSSSNTQGDVPDLELCMKFSEREILLFSRIWIINRSGLSLQYLNGQKLPTKSDQRKIYTHLYGEHSLDPFPNFEKEEDEFAIMDQSPTSFMRSSTPLLVSLMVVVHKGENLYNGQFLGSQSPYVRVSLFSRAGSNTDATSKKVQVIVFEETKPCPNGGIHPVWGVKTKNVLLLKLPKEGIDPVEARLLIEVRTTNVLGNETCLGSVKLKLQSILDDPTKAASPAWYKLYRQTLKPKGNKLEQLGRLELSFSVGSRHKILDQSGQEKIMATPVYHRRRSSISEEAFVDASQSLKPSMETRARKRLSVSELIEAKTTAMETKRKTFSMKVYLPTNRFDCITEEVSDDATFGTVFDSIVGRLGLAEANLNDYVFVELLLPKFVSLRSAGRPEAERWWGKECPWKSFVVKGSQNYPPYPHGVHLCHRIAKTTLRVYDTKDAPTAATSVAAPERKDPHLASTFSAATGSSSRRLSSMNISHGFTKMSKWSEALPFGVGGGAWDTLRVRTLNSNWSSSLSLQRNAMGSSGTAQVIALSQLAPSTNANANASTTTATTTTTTTTATTSNLTPSSTSKSSMLHGQYDLALWACYGIGCYQDTIIATFVPRYVLVNRCSFPLFYRQSGTKALSYLGVEDRRSFHWMDSLQAKSLRVTVGKMNDRPGEERALATEWRWSGSFSIQSVGTRHIKLRKKIQKAQGQGPMSNDGSTSCREIYILRCQIELLGGSILVIFNEEMRRWPPYRIDNFTSFRIKYKQKAWYPPSSSSDDDGWDILKPHSSCVYAWDDISSNDDGVESSAFLTVQFMPGYDDNEAEGGSADIETYGVPEQCEYRMDEMGIHKPIKLQRVLPSFVNCVCEGYMLKRDNFLKNKWNTRYFRLKGSMLYYFTSSKDWELKGIVDLRPGMVGGGFVSVFEKERKKDRGMFGMTRRFFYGSGDDKRSECSNEELDKFSQIMTMMMHSSILMASRCTLPKKADSTQMHFDGKSIVNFLIHEHIVNTRSEGVDLGCRMLAVGLLHLNEETTQESKEFIDSQDVYYSLKPMNVLGTTGNGLRLSKSTKDDSTSVDAGPFELSIVTSSKVYDFRVDSEELLHKWLYFLRLSARPASIDDDASNHRQFCGGAKENNIVTTAPTNTKTFIRARIRADGPSKVLELREFGEEDTDEKEDVAARFDLLSEGVSPSETTNSTGESNRLPSIGLKSVIGIFVTMHSLGVSMVNGEPHELAYFCLGGIRTVARKLHEKWRLSITIDNFQADNQTMSGTFPTILYPRTPALDSHAESLTADHVFQCANCGHCQVQDASIHFCCMWANEENNTQYFDHCSFWMYPLVVQCDEELLVNIHRVCLKVFSKPSEDISELECHYSVSSVDERSRVAVKEYDGLLMNEALLPLESEFWRAYPSTTDIRKVYFAVLHIHPIEISVSFRSDVLSSTSKLSWRLHVPDLDSAPIRLNALLIEHAFGTVTDMASRISTHYYSQLWRQLHRVLGSFDFLGNPVGFVDHIGAGVKDFFYEPLDGLRVGSKGFRRGLAKGTHSLLNNTIDGTFNAASKISGTLSGGFASMSFDNRYQQMRARERRKQVTTVREGLIQGASELSLGVFEGLSGLVTQPYRGAKADGALGLVKGTLAGIIGVPLKPVAGVFDFASRTSQGVKSRARSRIQAGQNLTRIRPPRVFGRHKQLKAYKIEDVIAVDLLKKLTSPTIAQEEEILRHFEVIEKVHPLLADDLQRHQEMVKNHFCKIESRKVFKIPFDSDSPNSTRLELQSDFHTGRVVVQHFSSPLTTIPDGKNHQSRRVARPGDELVCVGDVAVADQSIDGVRRLVEGGSKQRPVVLTFASYVLPNPVPNASKEQEVQLDHWLIVTEKRILYINITDFQNPYIEWTTPLACISDIDILASSSIAILLKVGVDSVPGGPTFCPKDPNLGTTDRNTALFQSIMQRSFRDSRSLAEDQEMFPSDTSSMAGYLIKEGAYTSGKRWFVLSRNCLYHFSDNTLRKLRGITPLGDNVLITKDPRHVQRIKIRNYSSGDNHSQLGLVSLHLEKNGDRLVERLQENLSLVASSIEEAERWVSCLEHASGQGLRHSTGTRFKNKPSIKSMLCIGCAQVESPYLEKELYETLVKVRKWYHQQQYNEASKHS